MEEEGLVRDGDDLQRGVECEGHLCTGGECLLAIVIEPPDSGDSGTYTEADDGSYSSADDGSSYDGAGGGEADGCRGGSGMDVAHDGAFAVDVGVFDVVEVGDVGCEFIGCTVGKADAVRLEANGRGA